METTESIKDISQSGHINKHRLEMQTPLLEFIDQFFPNTFPYIIQNTNTIQGLKDNRLLRIQRKSYLPFALFNRIYLLEYNNDILEKGYNLYYMANAKFHFHFSKEDFFLAMLGYALNYPVVSFDKHLLFDLEQQLPIRSIWPQDIETFSIDRPVLLDANIVIDLFKNKQNERTQFVFKMFKESNVRFMIPNCIFSEISHVLTREQKKQEQRRRQIKRKRYKAVEELYDQYKPNPKHQRRLGKKGKKH